MRVLVPLYALLWWGRTASSFAWTRPPSPLPATFNNLGQRGHRGRGVQTPKHLQWQPFLQVATYPWVDTVQPPASPSRRLPQYNRRTVKKRMKQLCQKYVALNERRPLATKGVSAAIVQGMGDILSQYLTTIATTATTGPQPFQWNMLRTLTFMFVGLCYKGPVLHVWYKALAKVAQWTKVRRGFSETQQSLTALTVDQTIGVAIFYPLYYVAYEIFSSVVSLQGTDSNMLGVVTQSV